MSEVGELAVVLPEVVPLLGILDPLDSGDCDDDGVEVGVVVAEWDAAAPSLVGAGLMGLMVEMVAAPERVVLVGTGVVSGTAAWHAPGMLAAASRPAGTGTRSGPEPHET